MITEGKGQSAPCLYVPILKAKQGERGALQTFDTSLLVKGLRPLFEIHPPSQKRKKPLAAKDHVKEVAEELSKCWAIDFPFYVDTIWLDRGDGSLLPPFIEFMNEILGSEPQTAIPVFHLNASTTPCHDVKNLLARHGGHGFAIRATPKDVIDHEKMASFARRLNIPIGQIDLIVDFESNPMNIAQTLQATFAIAAWRTVVCSSGSAPGSISGFEVDKWHKVSREDWKSFKAGLTAPDLPRKPVYSDYACRAPGEPQDWGSSVANLRYCLDDCWLVRRGALVEKGESHDDMLKICKSLIRNKQFCGKTFSPGDFEINVRGTTPDARPGGATQWIEWGVNHHLTYVMRQILTNFSDAASRG